MSDSSADDTCLHGEQVDDLLSLVAKLNEEVERARSTRKSRE